MVHPWYTERDFSPVSVICTQMHVEHAQMYANHGLIVLARYALASTWGLDLGLVDFSDHVVPASDTYLFHSFALDFKSTDDDE